MPLTEAEKQSARSGTVRLYSSSGFPIWARMDGDGQWHYSPDAKVARARGVRFRVSSSMHARPVAVDYAAATQVIEDVALWLGYPNDRLYNEACQRNPGEVERRLREAE